MFFSSLLSRSRVRVLFFILKLTGSLVNGEILKFSDQLFGTTFSLNSKTIFFFVKLTVLFSVVTFVKTGGEVSFLPPDGITIFAQLTIKKEKRKK